MPDINNLIKELDGLIMSVTSGSAFVRSPDKKIGIVGLDISISVRSLNIPDDIRREDVSQYRSEAAEPLVDVIESKESICVIAVFPGIKKEDVHYSIKDDHLELEIFKGRMYRKSIPCSIKPDEISVKSTTINNSVLEIVFSKSADPQENKFRN